MEFIKVSSFILTRDLLCLFPPGSAKTDVRPGRNLNSRSIASDVRNISVKNY